MPFDGTLDHLMLSEMQLRMALRTEWMAKLERDIAAGWRMRWVPWRWGWRPRRLSTRHGAIALLGAAEALIADPAQWTRERLYVYRGGRYRLCALAALRLAGQQYGRLSYRHAFTALHRSARALGYESVPALNDAGFNPSVAHQQVMRAFAEARRWVH